VSIHLASETVTYCTSRWSWGKAGISSTCVFQMPLPSVSAISLYGVSITRCAEEIYVYGHRSLAGSRSV